MALDLGELSIALALDNDKFRAEVAGAKTAMSGLSATAKREVSAITREFDAGGKKAGAALGNGLVRDASGKLRNARGQFASDAEIALAGIDPVAERKGKDTGGILAKGMQQGLTRNSPLIVAAITGALAAGAPAVLAGSTLLFAGIGAAAASQNDEVRAAWAGLGDLILEESRTVAAPVVDTFTRMADKIGASVVRLAPQITEAMGYLAPMVDDLTDSILAAGETAIPAMVRAVERGGPVFAGLGALVEDIGSGFAGFLDNISAHSGAAGDALGSIGDVLGELLPLLGELLGQGAELAADVLPVVVDSLGLVTGALQSVSGLLPAVVGGFAALKIVDLVGGWAGKLGGSLGGLVDNFTGAAKGAGGFGDRLRSTGEATADFADKAGPFVAAAIGIFVGVMQDAEATTNEWARSLVAGGTAAAAARAEMSEISAVVEDNTTGFKGFINSLTATGAAFNVMGGSVQETEQAQKDLEASMSAVEKTALRQQQAEHDLEKAVGDHGAGSLQAAEAQQRYEQASRENEETQADLEMALHGVTGAMVEQANQALAAIDSNFALANAQNQLSDAQDALADVESHLHDTNRDTRTSSEDLQRAQLAVAEQTYRTALAYGQQQADLSGLSEDTDEYARIVQEQALASLYSLQRAAGPEMAAALQQQIDMLEASGLSLAGTGVQATAVRDRMEELGISVRDVPDHKGVVIDAPTDAQRQRIDDLGYRIINLPNGQVYVTADTTSAESKIQALVAARRVINIVANVFGGHATGGPIHEYAAGGPITGPGTGTSDSIVAAGPRGLPNYRLSNGEHIVTAAEVRAAGGHGAVMAQRQAWAKGYAAGGYIAEDGTWVPPGYYDHIAGATDATLIASAQRRIALGMGLTPEQQAAIARQQAAQAAAATTRTAATATTTSGGGGCTHPLFKVDTVNVLEGTPREIAQQLAYAARVRS